MFQVISGKAHLTEVEVTQNNGIEAAIASGPEDGATIILYPGAEFSDKEHVTPRKNGH